MRLEKNAGRSGGRSEWYVPVVELQTQWPLLRPHVHHPPSMPSSGQRYSPIGQRRTGHLGVPQKVSLATGCVWDTAYHLICCHGVWPFQFVYLLVMVFCLEATAAALAYVNAGKVDSELAPFSSVFQRYTGSSQDPYSDAVDATQKEGCQVKLEEALLFVLHLIIWSSLAVALVETVGFVSVAQLMSDQPLLEYGILDREWA
eukprot:XP_014005852.1 PREDICTED: uncharacterized protein LOC106574474 isoform X5 [Salmo salar]